MKDNIKRTLYRLDKEFSIVIYKERAPIALPSILISKIEWRRGWCMQHPSKYNIAFLSNQYSMGAKWGQQFIFSD